MHAALESTLAPFPAVPPDYQGIELKVAGVQGHRKLQQRPVHHGVRRARLTFSAGQHRYRQLPRIELLEADPAAPQTGRRELEHEAT